MGPVVHHRGRRAVAAAAAGRMVGHPRRPLVRTRHHAAHVRGAEGPALSLVLRRHSDPADALALAAARPEDRAQPAHHRPAVGIPDRAVQWYGDLVGLLFYLFLLVGAANIALGGGVLYRKL